MELDARRN